MNLKRTKKNRNEIIGTVLTEEKKKSKDFQ